MRFSSIIAVATLLYGQEKVAAETDPLGGDGEDAFGTVIYDAQPLITSDSSGALDAVSGSYITKIKMCRFFDFFPRLIQFSLTDSKTGKTTDQAAIGEGEQCTYETPDLTKYACFRSIKVFETDK